jgi:hypothetical protein
MPSFWKSNRASKSHLFFPEQQSQQQQHPGELPSRVLCTTLSLSLSIQARPPLKQRPAELERLEKHASVGD